MILYLHGLNSAGSSGKAKVMRDAFSPIPVLSPTYPAHQPEQAVQTLSQELTIRLAEAQQTRQPLLLVGSSMGGFYGQYLSRRFPVNHLVMINPALEPWELLRQLLGWQYNEALDERYYLSEAMVAATRRYAIEAADVGVPVTLLLDKGDELIDWRIANTIYAGIAEIHAFEGGSHTFEHMDEALRILARVHQVQASALT